MAESSPLLAGPRHGFNSAAAKRDELRAGRRYFVDYALIPYCLLLLEKYLAKTETWLEEQTLLEEAAIEEARSKFRWISVIMPCWWVSGCRQSAGRKLPAAGTRWWLSKRPVPAWDEPRERDLRRAGQRR